jgi:hypothetical protein
VKPLNSSTLRRILGGLPEKGSFVLPLMCARNSQTVRLNIDFLLWKPEFSHLGYIHNAQHTVVVNLGFQIKTKFRSSIFIGSKNRATINKDGSVTYYDSLDDLAEGRLEPNDEFTIYYLRRKTASLLRENEELRTRVNFMPGGEGYYATKTHFEGLSFN